MFFKKYQQIIKHIKMTNNYKQQIPPALWATGGLGVQPCQHPSKEVFTPPLMVPRASKRVRSPVVSCSFPNSKNEQDSGHRQNAGDAERDHCLYLWVASFSTPWSPKLPAYPRLAVVLVSSSPHSASILEPSGGSTLEHIENIQQGIILFKIR